VALFFKRLLHARVVCSNGRRLERFEHCFDEHLLSELVAWYRLVVFWLIVNYLLGTPVD
jgi:hypothetical protein